MSVPYIPLWIDDLDAAIAHLTLEEEALYMRLLKLTWRTIDCAIINDIDFIARKVRADKNMVLAILKEFFTLDNENRWFQKRLKSEFDAINEKIEKRKSAGKLGGQAKARKENEKTSSNATILPCQPEPKPEPKPDVLDKDKPLSKTESGEIQFSENMKFEFQEFWEKYPNRCKEKQAKEAYEAARKQYSHEKIMDGLAQYIDAKPPDRAWMNPDNFLNNERFTDEPSPIKTKSNYRPNRPKVPDFNEVPFGGVSAKSCDLAVLGDEATIIDVQARRIA